MSNVSEVISLNISRETTAVSQEGFGTGMIMGLHKRFTERQQLISEASQALDLGFTSTDTEYVAAQKYFSQEVKSPLYVIGRQDTSDLSTITFDAPVTGKVYSININGQAMSFTATVAETTAAEVAAAFETANAAEIAAALIVFDDTAADGTATVTPTVASTAYTMKDEVSITVAVIASETLTDAYTAIKNEADSFYAVHLYTHVKADILEMAAVIESERKLLFVSSSESAAKDDTDASDTTSTLKALKDGQFFRTIYLWSGVADTQFTENAWSGRCLPEDPGSITWAYKQLAGVTIDNLTATEVANVKNKNGNILTPIKGVATTRDGKTTGGEWIDVMRGVDWFYARLTERLFSLLVNSPKVPYTDAGIALVESEVLAQRQEGIAVGFLSGSENDTTTVPKEKDVSFNDKANRILRGVEFEYELAGAIQFMVINGTVTA